MVKLKLLVILNPNRENKNSRETVSRITPKQKTGKK